MLTSQFFLGMCACAPTDHWNMVSSRASPTHTSMWLQISCINPIPPPCQFHYKSRVHQHSFSQTFQQNFGRTSPNITIAIFPWCPHIQQIPQSRLLASLAKRYWNWWDWQTHFQANNAAYYRLYFTADLSALVNLRIATFLPVKWAILTNTALVSPSFTQKCR